MTLILEVVTFAALAVAILSGCGFLWRPLLPWRARPFLPLLAPFLGLALIAGIARTLDAAGLPLARIVWPIVAVGGAGWTVALWGRRRRPPPELLAVLGLCALAFGLAISPLVMVGYLTTVGATIDAVTTATLAELLPNARPGLGDIAIGMAHTGELYPVGLLELLTGHRSGELLTLVMAVFFALTPAAVFVWARLGLRLRPPAALLAAGLTAISNLLLWAVFDNFLAQVVATSLFPLLLTFGIEGSRRRDWPSAATCGLLAAASVSTYPVYAAYAVGSVAVGWLVTRVRQPRRSHALHPAVWWIVVGLSAGAANGIAVVRAWGYLRHLTSLAAPGGIEKVGLGDLLVFPSLYEIVGLVSHLASALDLRLWNLPRGAVSVIAVFAAVALVYGVLKLPLRSRLPGAALFVVIVCFAAYQRFGVNRPHGFPYGWFKTVSLVALEAVVLLAAGLVAIWQRPRLRAVCALATCAIVVLNLINSAWTVGYTVQHTALTHEILELAQASAAKPAGARVFADVRPGLEREWIQYLWKDRGTLYFPDTVAPGRRPFLFWGLIDKQLEPRRTSEEPWHDAARSVVVWQNRRFAVRQRRDAVLASMTLERPLLRSGERLDIEVAAARQVLVTNLGGVRTESELGPGQPLHVQFALFALAGAAPRLAVNGNLLTLAPGGWLLDDELGCHPQRLGTNIVNLGGTAVLVSEIRVLSASAARGCLESVPIANGLLYVTQSVALPRVRYAALFWAPRDAPSGRRYLLGIHVSDVVANRPLGVWSLPLSAQPAQQTGSLEIDLGSGKSAATRDGQPVAVEVNALHLGRGEFALVNGFRLASVVWQLDPLAQISVDALLRFQRTDEGAVRATSISSHSPLTVIPGDARLAR